GPSRNHDDVCFRFGKNGHWANTCKTPEHLCKRYKAFVEGKEKEVNVNEIEPKNDTTYLEAADFIEGKNEINMD
ncbi:UDP-glucose flavonoid 3-O-glucosyltransferase 3-like, partial [Trifolium medium]|nr:UDP-glucose flavonoid 3-O-glucosyltransferase 3-like [Trifolium medium]